MVLFNDKFGVGFSLMMMSATFKNALLYLKLVLNSCTGKNLSTTLVTDYIQDVSLVSFLLNIICYQTC